MELTPELAKECREAALKKYQNEKEKFNLKMMIMGYYKVKSLLSTEGLKKISVIDNRREVDKNFNQQFSEKIWKITEEAWAITLEQLMIKFFDAYGLNVEEDIKADFQNNKEDEQLDFYV